MNKPLPTEIDMRLVATDQDFAILCDRLLKRLAQEQDRPNPNTQSSS